MYAGKSGDLPSSVQLPWDYFRMRGCFLDCRGPLFIHATSRWGFGVVVLTESHDISNWPQLGAVTGYGVTVGADVWIGSCSILTGCTICEGAIVAAGTVVRGQNVKSGTMVAGNPARVIARWDGQAWKYLPESESGYSRELA